MIHIKFNLKILEVKDIVIELVPSKKVRCCTMHFDRKFEENVLKFINLVLLKNSTFNIIHSFEDLTYSEYAVKTKSVTDITYTPDENDLSNGVLTFIMEG